jgi:hypothetical protein
MPHDCSTSALVTSGAPNVRLINQPTTVRGYRCRIAAKYTAGVVAASGHEVMHGPSKRTIGSLPGSRRLSILADMPT